MASTVMEFIDIDIGEDEREEILEKYTKLILEPYQHIADYSGKQVREKLLTSICNYWFYLTNEELDIINSFIFQVHNVSLLLDDIQDNSFKRRGAPAAHIIYGRARTISSSYYVLNNTLYENIPRHLQIPVRDWVAVISQRCLKGQIMDTYWRDNFICPTEEAYIDMIYKKTGAGFQLPFCIAMEFCAKKDKDLNALEALGGVMGLHFQLRDDYCNLKSDKYFKEKGFCEDITEGKFGYPIICALRNHPEDRRIVEILKMNTTDDEIKRECVELIEKYGGFEDTRNKLSTIREQISNGIDNLGGGAIKDLWMEIIDFQT